jgi:hypothetical protein
MKMGEIGREGRDCLFLIKEGRVRLVIPEGLGWIRLILPEGTPLNKKKVIKQGKNKTKMNNVGLKRNTIDKYYTKPEVVEGCIEAVKQHIHISPADLIIESSAGNGAFIEGIKSLSNHHLFMDLEPENDEIKQCDYLDYTPNEQQTIHVIGNPPFGRQSSTAIKFIKKSCEFCSTLSFILPKSFKKPSRHKPFPLTFHLIYEIDLPCNSFEVNGKDYDVPCVFQIWKRQNVKRQIEPSLEPCNFEFVRKEDNPDIAFRRVGFRAGTIDTYTADKNIQSHYFIKFKSRLNVIEKLRNVEFEFNNTVGPRSISKQELIRKYNPLLLEN